MARPRTLPPGIRPRGKSFVYDWRDATGKTFSRKAGDTVDEAIAFKAKIDAELSAGTFVAGSKTTFAEYAAHWIETYPLKSQTRRGYRSTLSAHLVPFCGRFAVIDSGSGIPPDELDALCQPMVRGDGVTGSGSGLGLAIVAEVLRAQGSRLTVTTGSTGATFAFTLPRVLR